MIKCHLTTLFGLVLIIILASGEPLLAQVSYLNYEVFFNARVFFDQPLQKSANFNLTVGPFHFSWSANQSGNVVQSQEVALEYSPYQRFLIRSVTLSTDLCLQLNRIAIVTDYYSAAQNWDVTFDGNNYVYHVDRLWWSSNTRILPDDLILEYHINAVTRTIGINLTLVANLAKCYMIDMVPLQKFSTKIVFNEPKGGHVGYLVNGDRFLIARYDLSNLNLSGRYLLELPTLESTPPRLVLPFEVNLNLDKANLEIGPQVLKALFNSTYSLINAANEFLDDTRVYAPDISAKLQQARSYLDDLVLDNREELKNMNVFPLEGAIMLACEASNGIYVLILSSGMLIVPVVLSIVLIASAVISHLVFNGSKKLTIALFILFSLVAFELHPGLRLILFSMKPKALIDLWSSSNVMLGIPFMLLPISSAVISFTLLLLTVLMMFKYSGTATIYSLAASTAIRMLKSRRLRGALVILTVITIAMATVPAVTLKTAVPLVASFQENQNGKDIIFFSKSWLARVEISTPGGSSEEEYDGLFLMSYDEAVFHTKKLGMMEYTPICIAFYKSSGLEGLIMFVNLTFMKNYLGLKFSGDLKNGILIDKELLQKQSFPNQLNVMGLNLSVTGMFDKPTLLMPNGEGLEDYLRNRPIFIGTINWDIIQTPFRLTEDAFLTEGNRMIIISSPIIGLVDIGTVKSLPAFWRVVTVIGTYPAGNLAEIEGYLKSLISSHKTWLSRAVTVGGGGISINVVASYSATMKKGSQQENIQLGAPLLMAFGSWESVFIMMLIGSLIILNAMLNSIYERRKESVIMSSLGASPKFITYLFLTEGLIIGVMGGSLGYVLGYVWAYSMGASTPEIVTELYGLTPLVLVFLISLLITGAGSAFPAKEAILKIVPSKIMLIRGGISIKTEKDGSKKALIPIRLKKDQLEPFSSFIMDMARSHSYSLYGIIVHSFERKADGVKLNLSYRALSGFSERTADYDVDVKYVPDRNFYNVELIVEKIERGSYAYVEHKALMKSMLYELRDELLKITVSKQWTAGKNED